jgi:hypothetical protein
LVRCIAERRAKTLLPFVRERRLEDAAFELRHPRQNLVGRDLLHEEKAGRGQEIPLCLGVRTRADYGSYFLRGMATGRMGQPGRSTQFDASVKEGVPVDLLVRHFIEIHDFHHRNTGFRKETGVHDLSILGIGRWRLLHTAIVRAEGDGAGFGQELRSLAIETGGSRVVAGCDAARAGW